jgi:hypothetical protein
MFPDWDDFVNSFAPSPFFLVGVLKSYSNPEGGPHRVFATVMRDGSRLVGLAVFRTTDNYILPRPRLFRFSSVEFLIPDCWSPDFVVHPDYRKEFVDRVMTLLFDRLGYQSASLTLSSDSPNDPVLREYCDRRGMPFSHRPSANWPERAVLSVKGTWADYLESRGKEFIRRYKRLERRMTRAGRWSISNGKVESQAIVDTILGIDRNSWKAEWRKLRTVQPGSNLEVADVDEDLLGILNSYKREPTTKSRPLYWILELNGRPIAFLVATVLGNVSYMQKTSYDASYRSLSPGDIINLRAFRDLFESGSISRLDFFTSFHYMRYWTLETITRGTFLIENHRGPFKLFLAIRRNKHVTRVWHVLSLGAE